VDEGVETLLVAEQTRPTAIFNVGVRLGREVREVRGAAAEELATAIDRVYSRKDVGEQRTDTPSVVVDGSLDVGHDLDAAVRDAERDVLNTQGKAPTVRLVDLVIFEALVRGASDVH